MASDPVPVDLALEDLRERILFLKRIEAHPAECWRIGPILRDVVTLANCIGEFLQYPETITKSLLLVMAREENAEWITRGFSCMRIEARAKTYAVVMQALTQHIEALYKKWHEYNNLGIDDADHLRALEGLLNKVADHYKLTLPERAKVIRKRFDNYVPVQWEQFLADLRAAVG
jgi:hypothetical protein